MMRVEDYGKIVARSIGRALAQAEDADTLSGILTVGEEFCQAMLADYPQFNRDQFMGLVDAFHAARVIELTHRSVVRHPSNKLKVVPNE
jgi:hypothetical protein